MGTAMRAKKLVILLAVLLVVGLGLFGWFRPREVVLPENCRLRVTIDSFSDDRIFVDDPEKKAQLLELLSALRVRRYFKQPESDFPPGLTLRVGEYARVEVFDLSNGIVAYYPVSLIQPPLGTFPNLSTQTRWLLQDNEAVVVVVLLRDQFRDAVPLVHGHIGGIQQRRKLHKIPRGHFRRMKV